MEILALLIVCVLPVGILPLAVRMLLHPQRHSSRATQPELYRWVDCDYRTDPPRVLHYGYIDWLERELKVGQYEPDRLRVSGEDPLEITEADERAAWQEHTAHIEEMTIANGVFGPRATESTRSYSRGGVLRTYIDSDGNQTAIRAFGS